MIFRFGGVRCAELDEMLRGKAPTVFAQFTSRIEECTLAYCHRRKFMGAFYEGEIHPLTVATEKYFFGTGLHTLMLHMKYHYFTDAKHNIHIINLLEKSLTRATFYSKYTQTIHGVEYDVEAIKFYIRGDIVGWESSVRKNTTLTFTREPVPLRRL